MPALDLDGDCLSAWWSILMDNINCSRNEADANLFAKIRNY